MFLSKVLRPLELTLAIIKPDVCRNPHNLQLIRQLMLNENFCFIDTHVTQLSEPEAERFYDEHRDRFFYNRLVTFMSSGLISVHILAREEAIRHWRMLMGPTHVYKAQYEKPDSIRARFGLTDTRNATHGSDSADSARREITFFFPKFSIDQWFKHHEPSFRNNGLVFDPERCVHKIKDEEVVQRQRQ